MKVISLQNQNQSTENLQKEKNSSEDNFLKPANYEEALKYKENHQISDEFKFCDSNAKFAEFGIGIQLFFEFLKLSAIAFWIMSLISIPMLYSNITGDGLVGSFSQQKNSIIATTLANQPQLLLQIVPQNLTTAEQLAIIQSNVDATNSWKTKMQTRQYMVTIPDLINCFVFLIFILYWRSKSKQIKKLSQTEEIILPSKYAIEFDGFDHTFTDEGKFSELFKQNFGNDSVYQVKLARNYQGTLFLNKEAAQIKREIKIETTRISIQKKNGNEFNEEKLEKLKKQLGEIKSEITEITNKKLGNIKSHSDIQTLKGIVVFEKLEQKEECIKQYAKATACCEDYPENLKFANQEIRISKKVDEPSNIKWENLELSRCERFSRSCCLILLILLVMSLTFSIIFISNAVKPTSAQTCVVKDITRAQAVSNKDLKNCFCLQQDIGTLQTDPDLKDFCGSIILEYAYNILFSVLTAIVVVVVNALLEVLIQYLGEFNKYRTITQEITGVMTNLFVAMFINTAILALILQADIFKFNPGKILTTQIFTFFQNTSAVYYTDFERAWYVDVGNKIISNIIFMLVSPHLIGLILMPLQRCLRTRSAKQKIFQSDMNELIVGTPINITNCYAIMINIIYCCMMYASAIPILYTFGAVSLTLQYWSYKYMFIRYHKIPPAYDTTLNKQLNSILPFSLLIHIAIAIYMFGQPLIFPASDSNISSQVSTSVNVSGTSDDSKAAVLSRIQASQINLILFALFIVIVLGIIIKLTLINFLLFIYNGCCKKTAQIFAEPSTKTYSDYLKSGQVKVRPVNYDITENENYSSLIKEIEHFGDDDKRQLTEPQEVDQFVLEDLDQNHNTNSKRQHQLNNNHDE